MSSYDWSTFDLDAALNGLLVGIQNAGEADDILLTGKLERNSSDPGLPYRVVLRGTLCYCNSTGLTYCPTDDTLDNQQLKNVKVVLDQTNTNVITRSSGTTTQSMTISSANPRDEFAMEVLNAIIQKQDNPQEYDDGSMLRTAQLAYRWANAMMEAAADNRYDDTQASQQGASKDDVAAAVSGDLKIKNAQTTGATPTTIPLVVNGSGTNGELTVKGNNTAGEGTSQVSNAINVAIVAGGGGGTSSVDLDDLIGAMGYAKETVPVSGDTQADKFDALTTAVTNIGKLKSSDVDVLSTESDIASLVVFKLNANNPYKVTPYTLTKAMYTYFDGRYGLKLNNVSDPTQITYAAGNYYNIKPEPDTPLNALSITLPALSVTGSNPVKIFIVRAKVTGTLTVTFSGDLMWRGSKQTSLNGEYEIDFIDNGTCWTVGVTEIVSN